MTNDSRFPFGLAIVSQHQDLCRRYAEAVPDLVADYPLPARLPRRHPVLQALEGRYPVQDTLPPWWPGCIDELIKSCPCLASLAHSIDREAFRRGCIEQHDWKTWRSAQCELPGAEPGSCWREHGSGLYWILDEVLPTESRRLWLDRFGNRGDKDTPHDLDLVLTAAPEWWLNMGNGRGWHSCMGRGSNRDQRVVGNWYDTGLLMAALVARDADCWAEDCLIARTTVRVTWEGELALGAAGSTMMLLAEPRVVFGRIYHNDLMAACNLLLSLARLVQQHGLAWGCIADTNTAQYARDGSLGAVEVADSSRTAFGPAFWRPAGIDDPYLDGEASYRERDEREQDGYWAYPILSQYACRLRDPAATIPATERKAVAS